LDIDDYSFRLTIPTTYIPKYLGDIQSFLSGGSNFKVTGYHESEENEDDDAEFFEHPQDIDNEEKKQSEIDRLKQLE